MIFKKFKIIQFIFIVAMFLSVSACKGGKTDDNIPTPTASPVTNVEITEQPDCTMIRQAMIDTTDMAAIAYLGTYAEYYNYSEFIEIQDFVADSGILDNHPFVAQDFI